MQSELELETIGELKAGGPLSSKKLFTTHEVFFAKNSSLFFKPVRLWRSNAVNLNGQKRH
jgi:hypothetical protein